MMNKLFRKAVSVIAGVVLTASLLPTTALAGVLSELVITYSGTTVTDLDATDVSDNDVSSPDVTVSIVEMHEGGSDGTFITVTNGTNDSVDSSTVVTGNGQTATFETSTGNGCV